MKVCFFLQRRFVLLGHSMAFHINKHYDDVQFCAFVSMRDSLEFLKKQKDVVYTGLLLEEDIHKKLNDEKIDFDYLRSIEKEYGIPNLWPYLYIDRVVMSSQLIREYPHNKALLSHKEMLQRLQITAKEIIAFLDREKPDVLFFSVIGSVGSDILYRIAQKRGIQTIMIDVARVNNRVVLTETHKRFTWVKKRFDELQAGEISQKTSEAKQILEDFRNAPSIFERAADPTHRDQTSRATHLFFLKPAHLFWSIGWHIKTLIKDFKKLHNHDYTDAFIWWLVWDKIKKKVRGIRGYTDLYSPVDPKQRFAYFPLHYDPEMATMLYAPYYADQIPLIKAIARSLPIDMMLYVKDHPPMVGSRTRAYYKELLKVPNIRLINPRIRGLDLVQKTALTLTITGTGGWESILFKKPIITFGDVYYNDVPGVKRCYGFEELPYLVKEQLETWKHDENSLLNYYTALYEDSIPLDYLELWVYARSLQEVMDNDGILKISHLLAQKIGLQKK